MTITSRIKEGITCPRCEKDRVWGDGYHKTGSGETQRYLCRDCGYRFTQGTKLNVPNGTFTRQVCDTDIGSKNLIVANDKQTTKNVINKKQILLDFAWWMKKKALADQTIESRTSILRTLINRQVNINDPESVIEYLASARVSPV